MFQCILPLLIFTTTSSSWFSLLATFIYLSSFLNSHMFFIRSPFLFPSFASFDFSHSQLLRPNRRKRFAPSLPHYLCLSLLCLSSPLLLSILLAAGLITACHKCLTFAQKVPAAPREPKTCRWLEGRSMPWQLHLQANGETHRDSSKERKQYFLVSSLLWLDSDCYVWTSL